MPPSKSAPVLLRANAGTGKTFQLSNRFIDLLARGASAESILATTFTRKAAGEIQARIFTRLAEAALDEKAAAKLASELERPDLTRARAAELLRALVADQHRLAICTLDSFFVRLLRMFLLELGLPPDVRIASQEAGNAAIAEAVQTLFGAHETEDLYTLLRLVAGGVDARALQRRVLDVVKNLYQTYRESPAEAWLTVESPEGFTPDVLVAAVRALEILKPPLKKDGTPNIPIQKALIKDLERSQREDWDGFLTHGIAGNLFKGENTFSKARIPEEYTSAYGPVVKHAGAALLRELRNKNEATHRLLTHFDAAYQREQTGRAILSFSDVKTLLARQSWAGSLDELYYRLDAEFSHLLLDEFQDTSLTEWRLIEPLADEILSKADGESSFFCVGDVKQAIYGWRGGVAEIFDAVTDRWPQIVPDVLEKSYRSAPEVIEIVNNVFSNVAGNTALTEFGEISKRWQNRFAAHSTARKDIPGFASVEIVAPGEDETEREALARRAAVIIKELHGKNPALSIGVLVPRNADVAYLIRELEKPEIGITASEEGGTPLCNTKAVLAFLSLFILTDHPGDTIARYHVAKSPLASTLEFPDWNNNVAAAGIASRLREEISLDGYGRTILRLLGATSEAWNARERRRIGQLAELGFSFDEHPSSRALDFVKLAALEKIEDARPAPVRVMTVHRSKGLEFDAVVLPFLDRKWLGRGDKLWTYYDSPIQPPLEVSTTVRKELRKLHPDLERLAQRAEGNRVLEALNVLYVALTRPRRALYTLLPQATADANEVLSSASVIRAALNIDPTGSGSVYSQGSSDWLKSGAAKLEKSAAVPLRQKTAAPKRSDAASAPRIATPSSLEGGDAPVTGHRVFADHGGVVFGRVLHKIFEAIEWIKSGERPEIPYEEIFNLAGVRRGEWDRYRKEFEAMLANPDIRRCFERPHMKGGRELMLYRELRFAHRNEADILNGAIDRLIVTRHAEHAETVEVMDFKTDAVTAAGLDERIVFYRPQIDAYRHAAARLFQVGPDAVKAKLVFAKAGFVREVR